MKTRSNPTPAAVQQALEHMARLAAPTPRERAERRFMDAKAAFTVAAEAVMRQEIGAAQRADDAIAELNRARAELVTLDAEQEAT